MSTPDEVEKQLLAHPECPTETWWEIAAKHPVSATHSTLYPLLTLEDPARWASIWETFESRCHTHSLDVAIKALWPTKAAQLVAECLQRANLPLRPLPTEWHAHKAMLNAAMALSARSNNLQEAGWETRHIFLLRAECAWQWRRTVEYLRGEVL